MQQSLTSKVHEPVKAASYRFKISTAVQFTGIRCTQGELQWNTRRESFSHLVPYFQN